MRIDVATLLDGAATEGRLALLEVSLPAGGEIPPHAAAREELIVYVVAGEVELRRGGEVEALGPGAVRKLEPGSARGLRAAGPATLLCLLVPAGSERLAAEFATGQLDRDDAAALLTAAGIAVLPRLGSLPGAVVDRAPAG